MRGRVRSRAIRFNLRFRVYLRWHATIRVQRVNQLNVPWSYALDVTDRLRPAQLSDFQLKSCRKESFCR